ncbi:MAG: hypothetical protein ACAH11_06785 [Sphingomonas sp.]
MRLTPPNVLAAAAALLLFVSPGAALAYTGPGLGLGAIGVAFGLIGSLLLGIVSLVWYPEKRLIRRIRK